MTHLWPYSLYNKWPRITLHRKISRGSYSHVAMEHFNIKMLSHHFKKHKIWSGNIVLIWQDDPCCGCLKTLAPAPYVYLSPIQSLPDNPRWFRVTSVALFTACFRSHRAIVNMVTMQPMASCSASHTAPWWTPRVSRSRSILTGYIITRCH